MKKNKINLYKKARANKTVITSFWVFFSFLLFGGIVTAVTTITDQNINSPTGTYTNITISDTLLFGVATIQSDNETHAPIYSSGQTGLDDLSSSGVYTLNGSAIFQVKINSTGTPDNFVWRNGSVGAYSSEVAMTGSAQLLQNGISVTWGATTGHDVNDVWEIHAGDELHIESTVHVENDLFVTGDLIVEGNSRSLSPFKFLDGLKFINKITGDPDFHFYISGSDSATIPLPSAYDGALVFKTHVGSNIYDMDAVFWDAVNGNPSFTINQGGTFRSHTLVGSIQNVLRNKSIDENYTKCMGVNYVDCDDSTTGGDIVSVDDIEALGSIYSNENITAQYFIGDGIGIGTTDPNTKFSIKGDDDKDTGAIITLSGNAINQVESGRIRFTETDMYYQGGFIYFDGSTNTFKIGVHDNADNLISSDINAISILRSNGYVGMGTVNPGNELEIYSTTPNLRLRDSGDTATSTTAFIEFGGTDAGVWSRTGYIGDGGSSNTIISVRAEIGDLHLGDSSSSSTMVLNSGKVGIGISIPDQILHLFDNTNAVTLHIESNAPDGNAQLQIETASDLWTLYNDESDGQKFKIWNDGDKFTIQSDGKVGIGTITPTNLLTINGSGMLQLEMNTTTMICNEANAGAIYYNNATNKHYGCNVISWNALY